MKVRSLRLRITAWYAGLLTGSLALFGASVYAGLYHYLDSSLRKQLSEQTRSIGESFLANVSQRGESYVVGETNEAYAPEISGRFFRITRGDGSVMYESGAPRDGSFDPHQIPPVRELSGEPEYRQQSARRQTLLIQTFPYTTPDGKTFLVEAGASLQPINTILHGLLLNFALGLPLIVAVAFGGGYWLMRRALQPVDDITRQAERISSRNMSERLPVIRTGDEIERLSISLNRMIARLEDSFQHINRFSADVSHELRTPLTILRGELEAIARDGVSPEVSDMIGSALEETDRLTKIVEHLLAVARLDAGEACRERVRLDLGLLAKSTTEQMRLLADEKSISLQYDVVPGVEVEADISRLRQVIANLVDNAIKYTPEGGWVKVSVYSSDGRGVLRIADNGVGIPSHALPHIFDRFYREDKARMLYSRGAGLGLSIVKAICAAHGAEIKVSSAESKGSSFGVELALANGQHSIVNHPDQGRVSLRQGAGSNALR